MKIISCFECGKQTTNPKFCCQSCSAKNTNVRRPTRRTKKCRRCESLIEKRFQYCDACKQHNRDYIKNKTLEQIIIKKGHRCLAFVGVRDRAKNIARRLGWNSCACCGYSKYIEICHLKPISDFSLDAKVSDINSLSNIVPLCPNCHREFDNNLMDENYITKIQEFTSPTVRNCT